jgi:hypothetical protein
VLVPAEKMDFIFNLTISHSNAQIVKILSNEMP